MWNVAKKRNLRHRLIEAIQSVYPGNAACPLWSSGGLGGDSAASICEYTMSVARRTLRTKRMVDESGEGSQCLKARVGSGLTTVDR